MEEMETIAGQLVPEICDKAYKQVLRTGESLSFRLNGVQVIMFDDGVLRESPKSDDYVEHVKKIIGIDLTVKIEP